VRFAINAGTEVKAMAETRELMNRGKANFIFKLIFGVSCTSKVKEV
jgi:hypothetical protein